MVCGCCGLFLHFFTMVKKKRSASSSPLCAAAYFEDVVVGAVCCRTDKNAETGVKTVYIMTLVCLAQYRRRGIGADARRAAAVVCMHASPR